MARRLRDPATVWPCTEALADLARSPQAREALSVMLDSSSRTSESQLSNKLLGRGETGRNRGGRTEFGVGEKEESFLTSFFGPILFSGGFRFGVSESDW
eukprot:898465-Amorphochlora_amoeboformis.AAC.1